MKCKKEKWISENRRGFGLDGRLVDRRGRKTEYVEEGEGGECTDVGGGVEEGGNSSIITAEVANQELC